MRCPLGLTPGSAQCPKQTCLDCLREIGDEILYEVNQTVQENAHLKRQLLTREPKPRHPQDLRKLAISVIFAACAMGALIGRSMYDKSY